MNDKVVWLIDDDRDEADQYERLLERSARLNVICQKPRVELPDYNDLIADPKTGAFVIDYKLDQGGIDYDGPGLAQYLRTQRPELPIYLLTNYAPDATDAQASEFEEVINKTDMRTTYEVHVVRILRGIGRYQEALSRAQARLKDLVERKLGGTITAEEDKELESLRAHLELPSSVVIGRTLEERDKTLAEQGALMERLERVMRRLGVEEE